MYKKLKPKKGEDQIRVSTRKNNKRKLLYLSKEASKYFKDTKFVNVYIDTKTNKLKIEPGKDWKLGHHSSGTRRVDLSGEFKAINGLYKKTSNLVYKLEIK